VRTYDPRTRLCNGSYYPKLREHLETFREKIDGPVVRCCPAGRTTAGGRPANTSRSSTRSRPRACWRRFAGTVSPFPYLSGLFYTFQNEGRDGGDLSSWERYANSLVIDPASGKPNLRARRVFAGREKRLEAHSYQFCPAAPGVKEFFRR